MTLSWGWDWKIYRGRGAVELNFKYWMSIITRSFVLQATPWIPEVTGLLDGDHTSVPSSRSQHLDFDFQTQTRRQGHRQPKLYSGGIFPAIGWDRWKVPWLYPLSSGIKCMHYATPRNVSLVSGVPWTGGCSNGHNLLLASHNNSAICVSDLMAEDHCSKLLLGWRCHLPPHNE